jgi:membrane-associated phospholipid phosphatase
MGALQGLLAAVLTGLLPPLYLVLGTHRGWWGEGRMGRQDRVKAAPGLLALVTAGTALLFMTGVPTLVLAMVIALLAVLAAGGAVTMVWQVSEHTAVAAGASTVMVLSRLATSQEPFQYTPAWGLTPAGWAWPVLLALVVVLVSWSRVQLRCHTPAQVVVGVGLGATVGGAVFTALT